MTKPGTESLFQERIEVDADTHVHVSLTASEKPAIDFDVSNRHGRRVVSVRSNGMVIGSLLLDVADGGPVSRRIERFCPYCGEERNPVASVDHHVC